MGGNDTGHAVTRNYLGYLPLLSDNLPVVVYHHDINHNVTI